MNMKKILIALSLMLFCLMSFGQKVIIDNSEPVPDNPDVYAQDKDAYDMGYRLGKMYALRSDLDNYKWACNSTAESRNQYPSEQAFYENKLLGIVAGWMDNRVPISNTTYMDVKSIMRQSHTFKWVVTVDNIYGIRVAKYWLP